MYAQANHLHSSGSAAAAMARLRIWRHHPRLDGRAGQGQEVAGGSADEPA